MVDKTRSKFAREMCLVRHLSDRKMVLCERKEKRRPQ